MNDDNKTNPTPAEPMPAGHESPQPESTPDSRTAEELHSLLDRLEETRKQLEAQLKQKEEPAPAPQANWGEFFGSYIEKK